MGDVVSVMTPEAFLEATGTNGLPTISAMVTLVAEM